MLRNLVLALTLTLLSLLSTSTAFKLTFYSVGCWNETKRPHGKPLGSDIGYFVKDYKKRCHNTVPAKAKSIFIDPDDDTDDVNDILNFWEKPGCTGEFMISRFEGCQNTTDENDLQIGSYWTYRRVPE